MNSALFTDKIESLTADLEELKQELERLTKLLKEDASDKEKEELETQLDSVKLEIDGKQAILNNYKEVEDRLTVLAELEEMMKTEEDKGAIALQMESEQNLLQRSMNGLTPEERQLVIDFLNKDNSKDDKKDDSSTQDEEIKEEPEEEKEEKYEDKKFNGKKDDKASRNYSYLNNFSLNTERMITKAIESLNEIADNYKNQDTYFAEQLRDLEAVQGLIVQIADLNKKADQEKDEEYKGQVKAEIKRLEEQLQNVLSKLDTVLANKIWENRQEYIANPNKIDEEIKNVEIAREKAKESILNQFKSKLHGMIWELDILFKKGEKPEVIHEQLLRISELKFNDEKLDKIIDKYYSECFLEFDGLRTVEEISQHKSDDDPDKDKKKKDDPGKDDPGKDVPPFEPYKPSELPEMPQNINSNPEKTRKTWVALVVGIGVGVGVFFTAGSTGVIALAVGGGLLKRVVAAKRNKLRAAKLQQVNKFNEMKQTIVALTDKIRSNEDQILMFESIMEGAQEDKKEQINARIEQLKAQNEQLKANISELTEAMEEIKEGLTVTEVVEPEPGIKGMGQRVKNFFNNEENLRDITWFLNGAIYSGLATNLATNVINLVHSAAPAGPASGGSTGGATGTPATPDAGSVTPTSATPVEATTGHGIGDSLSDLNLTHGHDTAQWALDGTHTESLKQGIMQDGSSTLKRIFYNKDGVATLYNGNLSVEQLAEQMGSENVILDVAKGSASRAWITAKEAGIGGVSL